MLLLAYTHFAFDCITSALLLAYKLFPLDYTTSGLLTRKRCLTRLTLSCCLPTRSVINQTREMGPRQNLRFSLINLLPLFAACRMVRTSHRESIMIKTEQRKMACRHDDADPYDRFNGCHSHSFVRTCVIITKLLGYIKPRVFSSVKRCMRLSVWLGMMACS